MHHPITTLKQLKTLQSDTLIYAVIVMLVALFLSFIIATIIPYQGAKDRSYIGRRIASILCCVVSALGFWLYNQTLVMSTIRNVGFQNQFAKTNLYALAITIIGYGVLGLIIALVFKKSKFATIFFNHKK